MLTGYSLANTQKYLSLRYGSNGWEVRNGPIKSAAGQLQKFKPLPKHPVKFIQCSRV
jgi:hypothetical protein